MVGKEEVTNMIENNGLEEGAGEAAPLKQKGDFERSPHPGCVYFIRVGDAIKIGFAENFKRRLGTLQTSHEIPLEVLAVISSASINEYETHQRFAHLRTRGEWFRAEQELIQFIEYAKVKFGEAARYQKAPKRPPAPKRPTLARKLYALRTKHRGNEPITNRISILLGQLKTMEAPSNPAHKAELRRLIMHTSESLNKLLQGSAA